MPEVDCVALVTPPTNETRGMIGSQELEVMKESAFIINVGRGTVMDEGTLTLALQKGQIAGTGLSPRYHERAMALFLDNLDRYTTG